MQSSTMRSLRSWPHYRIKAASQAKTKRPTPSHWRCQSLAGSRTSILTAIKSQQNLDKSAEEYLRRRINPEGPTFAIKQRPKLAWQRPWVSRSGSTPNHLPRVRSSRHQVQCYSMRNRIYCRARRPISQSIAPESIRLRRQLSTMDTKSGAPATTDHY